MSPISLLLAAVAAAEPCQPLDETAFRSFVLDAQAGIDRGDIELPETVLAELDARIACLTFAPAPRMWADLLVARAIVQFSRGGDWQSPLAAALRIRPAIDRGVGQGHPMASWTPPAPAEPGVRVPPSAQLYVDGLPATREPPSQGLWLVQRTDGNYWNTLLLQDEPLPEGWATGRVDQPPRISGWARVGGLVGAGTLTQASSWGSDIYFDVGLGDLSGPSAGVAGDAQLTILSPAGFLLQASAPFMRLSPGYEGRASAIWTWHRLTVGGGFGTASVETWEGDPEDPLQRGRMLRYGQATVLLRPMRPVPWDLAVSLGGSGAIGRFDLAVGGLLPKVGGERFRLSLNITGQAARFVQSGLDGRSLDVSSSRTYLRLDWVWGEY